MFEILEDQQKVHVSYVLCVVLRRREVIFLLSLTTTNYSASCFCVLGLSSKWWYLLVMLLSICWRYHPVVALLIILSSVMSCSKARCVLSEFLLLYRVRDIPVFLDCLQHFCVLCADKEYVPVYRTDSGETYQADSGGAGDNMDACIEDVELFYPHEKADVVVALATVQGTTLTTVLKIHQRNLENVSELTGIGQISGSLKEESCLIELFIVKFVFRAINTHLY